MRASGDKQEPDPLAISWQQIGGERRRRRGEADANGPCGRIAFRDIGG